MQRNQRKGPFSAFLAWLKAGSAENIPGVLSLCQHFQESAATLRDWDQRRFWKRSQIIIKRDSWHFKTKCQSHISCSLIETILERKKTECLVDNEVVNRGRKTSLAFLVTQGICLNARVSWIGGDKGVSATPWHQFQCHRIPFPPPKPWPPVKASFPFLPSPALPPSLLII